MPGLIDAYAHISVGRLEQSLAFGVTTVLDMFNTPDAARQMKTEAEGSPGTMASLYSSGIGATAPGCWPWDLVEAGIFAPFPPSPTSSRWKPSSLPAWPRVPTTSRPSPPVGEHQTNSRDPYPEDHRRAHPRRP